MTAASRKAFRKLETTVLCALGVAFLLPRLPPLPAALSVCPFSCLSSVWLVWWLLSVTD